MAQRRIKITAFVNVDPVEMAAEYGEDPYTVAQVREKLAYDVAEHIRVLPYGSALSNVEVHAR